jgi:hypothetical protein
MTAYWKIIGFRGSDPVTHFAYTGHSAAAAFCACAAEDVTGVAVIAPDIPALPMDVLQAAVPVQPQPREVLALFVPWHPPPVVGCTFDPSEVQSFYCSVGLARAISARFAIGDIDITSASYAAVEAVASETVGRSRLLAVQYNRETPQSQNRTCPDDVAVIMAHRGQRSYLAAALKQIGGVSGSAGLRVRVGLDAENVEEYSRLADCFPLAKFYRAHPSPAGPYVIRRHLIGLSREPWILFHDSDDMSCSDRLERLLPEFENAAVGIVGSHEIRFDEIARRLIAVRYPLDVTQALTLGPANPQLHPSTMVRRSAYDATGGFSTHSMYANDSQFLRRAYFYVAVRNVDEFLYIRRKHPAALTVREDTGLGTRARLRLEDSWRMDFRRVQRGEITLENSQLRTILPETSHTVRRVFDGSETLRAKALVA